MRKRSGARMSDPRRAARIPRVALAGGLALAIAAAAAGCGGSSGGSSTASGSSVGLANQSSNVPSATKANQKIIASISTDAKLAKQVPAAWRKKGTLSVGTDPSLPPDEFTAADGKTIVGYDPDLGHAIAKVLGLKFSFVGASFDGLIPGVQSGKYDLAMSSAGAYAERTKVVDFATYVYGGLALMTLKTSEHKPSKMSDLCGLKVAVARGSVEAKMVEGYVSKCPSSKPLQAKVFNDNDAVNLAVQSRRVDAAFEDLAVVSWTSKNTNGKVVLTGTVPDPAGGTPQGVIVPKSSDHAGAKVISAAIQVLIDNGDYQKLFGNWGITQGLIKQSKVVADK